MKKRSAKREYIDYIADIDECIEKIESFIEGFDFESFRTDPKTQDAIIRRFEIIGEATRSIPSPVKHLYPDVPWKDMADTRNKLIHEYFGVDVKVVWKAI